MYVFSIVLIVISNVMYNISQKSTPHNVNPFTSLFVTYVVAALVTLVTSVFVKSKEGFFPSFGHLTWTSYLLGGAIVGLELGYLFAYRAGWKLSVVTLVANICLALILVCIGTLIFKEHFEWYKVIGFGLCIGGLLILNS
jgi:uncharacterized membrane protein